MVLISAKNFGNPIQWHRTRDLGCSLIFKLQDRRSGECAKRRRRHGRGGVLVGGGQMVEAPESGEYVRYASIYRSDLVGAGRVN